MGEFIVQISVKGIDEGGREVMWNVAGKTSTEFDAEYAKRLPSIKALKPIPVKQYGGTGKPRREIKPLPDAPLCPTHQKPMNPKKWTPQGEPDKVLFFWSCAERTNGEYCKEKLKEHPTADQYATWCKLNEIATDQAPAQAEQSDAQRKAEHDRANGKSVVIKTGKWKAALEELGALPYYQKNGGVDTWHILGAAAKLNYTEITDDNIAAVIAQLKAHAQAK